MRKSIREMIPDWRSETCIRVRNFILTGSIAAMVNLGSMVFFIEVLGFNTYLLKNIANALSIEISVVANFIMCRQWTWQDAPRKAGMALVGQFASFNVAVMTGVVLRIALFAVLDLTGISYILNTVVGIGVVACFSFFLYDKLVFKRPAVEA